LRGWPTLTIAGFVAGGHAALHSIARADFDVLGHRCTARRRDVAINTARMLATRSRS
jgi:hypothetical protein